MPACTELTDILNKLVNPETIDLADDIDEDEMAELKGVHIPADILRENRKRVIFRFQLEVLEDLTQRAVCLQIIAALTDDLPKPGSVSFLLQQQESWPHSKQSCSTGQHRHIG